MFAYCNNSPVCVFDSSGSRCIFVDYLKDSTNRYIDGTDFNSNYDSSTVLPPAPADYRTYNTEIESYINNCYSYAIGFPCRTNPGEIAMTFRCFDNILKQQLNSVYYSRSFTVWQVASLVEADMAAMHKKCRRIASPSEALPGETVIALKTGTYIFTLQITDYHFAVLLPDGTWVDKPGNTPVRKGVISGYDAAWPLTGISDDYYSSPTIFFAIGG